jgi:hypothetical protein
VKKAVVLLAAVLIVTLHASAEKPPDQETHTSSNKEPAADARTFIELFTRLEREWLDAAGAHNRDALETLLAPEFVQRSSKDPEHLMSRAEWIEGALAHHDNPREVRALTIRAFLGVAVVSFVESHETALHGHTDDGDRLIVDIWRTNHGQWQPALRFVTPTN